MLCAYCETTMYFFCQILYSICGPNSEIEWNKEGSRGHAILNRTTAHTALSVAADHASAFGAQLNHRLDEPANTARDKLLSLESTTSKVNALVTEDPQMVDDLPSSKTNFMFLFSFALPICLWLRMFFDLICDILNFIHI